MGPSDAGSGEATRDACRMKCKITSDARDDVSAKNCNITRETDVAASVTGTNRMIFFLDRVLTN